MDDLIKKEGSWILPFSPPSYTEIERDAVRECVEKGWTGSGPKLKAFEDKFAKYKSVPNAAGFSSCTSALFLALKALEIGIGDEVITTSMTFCSTVNVILHCGATAVICDIDDVSKNIDPEDIFVKITPKTKAIIVVHYAGYPCDMDRIMEIAEKYNLYVIEDCAHAIEAVYKGKKCGSIGTIGCFSFYATKNIAIGEGGMAISTDGGLIKRMALLGLHGLSKDAWKRFEESSKRSYNVIDIGYKMNLTDLHASIGICQLERLGEMSERRNRLWTYYINELSGLELELPSLPIEKGSTHAMHLFTCGLPPEMERDEFVWKCGHEDGLTMGVHYNSIGSFEVYRRNHLVRFAKKPWEQTPKSWKWGRRTVSLSMSAAVSDSDAERIVCSIKKRLVK